MNCMDHLLMILYERSLSLVGSVGTHTDRKVIFAIVNQRY
jgi:hypothetical protein